MMQAHSPLDKAFTVVCRSAWLNAHRGPATNAVEEALTIEYRLHAEVRQEFPGHVGRGRTKLTGTVVLALLAGCASQRACRTISAASGNTH